MGEIFPLFLLLLLLSVLLRLDVVFYLLYVLFGVYALSRWWTNRGLRTIEVQRLFTDHAFHGERVVVNVGLQNTALLPVPWVRVHERLPLELHSPSFERRVTSLAPRERVEFSYELDCRRRGYYRIGPLDLSGGDLFGFAEATHLEDTSDHLTVYPQIIPLTDLGLPSTSPFGTIRSNQRIFEDPARATGVRDYRAGDPLHRIHWKASARQDGLLVKQYQPAISLHTAIFLNLNEREYDAKRRFDAPEWAIVVAASIANHLVDRRQAVGLTTNGRTHLSQDGEPSNCSAVALSLPPRPGRLHLMKVLELLAVVEPQRTEPFSQWIQSASQPLSWGDTIVAITPAGDEATCSALHQLCRRGFNLHLIVIQPQAHFSQVRERSRRLGFMAQQITDLHDMEVWRR
jgi:uncharacterized protein (DUF58 family)